MYFKKAIGIFSICDLLKLIKTLHTAHRTIASYQDVNALIGVIVKIIRHHRHQVKRTSCHAFAHFSTEFFQTLEFLNKCIHSFHLQTCEELIVKLYFPHKNYVFKKRGRKTLPDHGSTVRIYLDHVDSIQVVAEQAGQRHLS